MTVVIIIVVALVVIGVLAYILIRNSMVAARNQVDEAWSGIDVQLKRRHDLVPNLVETVKGYAAHERQTFERVTEARARAQQAGSVQEQAGAENELTAAIGRLFAVAEDYPELRASENFQDLQRQLEETEQKIAVARQIYNDAVLSYDNALETVPTNVVAAVFSFEPRVYFEIEEPAREAPRVAF
jgi:LemA protein